MSVIELIKQLKRMLSPATDAEKTALVQAIDSLFRAGMNVCALDLHEQNLTSIDIQPPIFSNARGTQ